MTLEKENVSKADNSNAVDELRRRWQGARVTQMTKSEIRQSESLWRSSDRWKIIDSEGKNLDTQQGYGYKRPYTAQKIIDQRKKYHEN